MAEAIFIAGYYRSGTSALSGVLAGLGVKFYNEADPNEHNPLGFYEIPELIQFDAELFSRLGVDWTDVRGLAPGWDERADMAPFLSRLEEVIRRRFPAEHRLWGLKHPHLCRTLPLYERAARQAGHTPHVVHIFRDPYVSAASQQVKNGLSRAHALLLWMSYATSAERAARHLPRAWLTYQELMAQPLKQIARIEAEASVRLPKAGAKREKAAAHLTAELNRAKALPEEDLARPLRELVARCWEAISERQFAPALWDDLAAETADLVGFLTEIGASRGRVIPALGGSFAPMAALAPAASKLRPPEREDDGARARLLARAAGALPEVEVVVVAPKGRAYALNETLESLKGQWRPAARVSIVAAEVVNIEGVPATQVADAPGATTRAVCEALNAAGADYVAVINAGDTLAPDAVLRFALLAGETAAGMVYCDEIVPREGGAWMRAKPGWDVTRLRQAAYIGDWVWYGTAALRAAGGFNPELAGAEEYDAQLRLAETGARVERLPEALFTRCAASTRDAIGADVFCARARDALAAHLTRAGMKAEVQNRQYPGLFHHARVVADPGTSVILLCDHAEIPQLDTALTALLTGVPLSGPVILAGARLSPGMQTYLAAVTQQSAALEGKVLAIAPGAAGQGVALAQALALAQTPLVAVLDARALPREPYWAEALRGRLADPGVVLAGARTLVLSGADKKQAMTQGPLVLGADTRLGAGHMADDPGPGGWLIVDQEASALAPPGLLARRAVLASCVFPDLSGDALWLDLGAQLRAAGGRLVWTPDVSFLAPPEVVSPDTGAAARQHGSPAAQALPWADAYHHPALSLHGDLLAPEARTGLVRATPADPLCLLVTGPADTGAAVLNAARALRLAGALEAGWAPDAPAAADIHRLAPALWLRVNPVQAAAPLSPGYDAVFTTLPGEEARPALAGAGRVFATSPGIAAGLRALAAPGQSVALWRPALSPRLWTAAKPAALNTKPRLLWFDEGVAPLWLPELIEATKDAAAWIVVERSGQSYPGVVSRLAVPETEASWAAALAELAPQVLLRPAATQAHADHYPALLAAAAGCALLVDERFDLPSSLGAKRLPPDREAWLRALHEAIANLQATLKAGAAARAAALALPSLETAPPPWAPLPGPAYASAAE
jgi:hypothetical protein